MFTVEGKLKDNLLELLNDALPREVGGVIIDGQHIMVLTNHAEGNSSFEFRVWELREAINDYGMGSAPGPEIADRVTLWHTHPGGGVGPSREDMRNKTPLKYHLVLALVEGDIVPTWY